MKSFPKGKTCRMKGFSKIRDSMIFLNNFYLRKGRASARKSGGGNLTFSGCQCRSGRYEIAIKKEGVCVKTQCLGTSPL